MKTEDRSGKPEALPAVVSRNLLDAKCEEWTYKHDNEWTHIYDQDGHKVTTFFRKMTYNEVHAFKAGWGIGWDKGRIDAEPKAYEQRKSE